MGNEYVRNDTANNIADGNVISAADLDGEVDKLLGAFNASAGHTHDGTTGEGGPITKLLGTAITIGDGTAGTDIAVTFDGETSEFVKKQWIAANKDLYLANLMFQNKDAYFAMENGERIFKTDKEFFEAISTSMEEIKNQHRLQLFEQEQRIKFQEEQNKKSFFGTFKKN